MSDDVLIPPDIVPTNEEIELVDAGTVAFVPQFAQALTQRQQYFEPFIKVTQTWQGLKLENRSRMLSVVNRLQGGLRTLRALVGYARRGVFPATELISNNDFSNGTTGWTVSPGGGQYTTVASNKILRLKALQHMNSSIDLLSRTADVNVTQYSPLVWRTYLDRRNYLSEAGLRLRNTANTSIFAESPTTDGGYRTLRGNPYETSIRPVYNDQSTATDSYFGHFIDFHWTSLAHCMQVDNSPNSLTNSDAIGSWTLGGATVSSNSTTDSRGNVTADSLIEGAAGTTHTASSNTATTSSGLGDYCFTVEVKANTRTFCAIQLIETTSNTNCDTWYVNLSTGATLQGSTAGNWVNTRGYITFLGNGWYRISVIARKNNSATGVIGRLFVSTALGTISYSGDGASSIFATRAGLAQSSVPFVPALTTSTTDSGAQQTGNALRIKGCFPVSTDDLLMPGDLVEVNHELKILNAPFHSDASGNGMLLFGPSLYLSPADGDAVVVGQPMGRFMLMGNPKWTNKFGQYADLTLTYRHIYE